MTQVEEKQDNLPLSTSTIEEAGAARKRIKIDIPAERIKGKLDEAFGELQRDAVMPGFRRGRAPKRLIEKRFGGDLRNTVKQQLVAEAYEKAVEDQQARRHRRARNRPLKNRPPRFRQHDRLHRSRSHPRIRPPLH